MIKTKQGPTPDQYKAALALVVAEHHRWTEDNRTGTRLHLAGANLTRADLSEAYLYGANLTRADLREVDLTKASFLKANLSEADLTGARLTGADLRDAVPSHDRLSFVRELLATATDAEDVRSQNYWAVVQVAVEAGILEECSECNYWFPAGGRCEQSCQPRTQRPQPNENHDQT